MRKVTVFGGTGFLGRRIVRHLTEHGFAVQIATRHPEHAGATGESVEAIHGDVNDEASLRVAVLDAFAVINAVSLYVERGDQTFHSIHVEVAGRVAREARRAGAARLIHVSGIGADIHSASPYIRSRGEGERAVRSEFPDATIIRPAVMFGQDDSFLIPLVKLLRSFPAFPLFGRGETKLQPAYVEDVAEACACLLEHPQPRAIYELAGPQTYSYARLLREIAQHICKQPLLIPVPFPLWRALAPIAELLPSPPVTRNQIELMEIDTVASSAHPGFDALGIEPRGIDAVLAMVSRKG